MIILDLVKEGLRIARTQRSLWLFGFFVGLGSGGGSSGGGGGGGGAVGGPGLDGVLGGGVAVLLVALAVVLLAGLVMHFLSEGALIRGVAQTRQGKPWSWRDGFREGWAHWGALFRIAVIYFAISAASVALLAAPCLIAAQGIGWPAAFLMLGMPALLVAVPWLTTLYMWRAFAARIAVLENRRTLDAIRKARLFLHGRLLEGLRLIVAAFLGTLVVVAVGAIVLVPAVLLVVELGQRFGGVPAAGVGLFLLLPLVFVVIAVLGTLQSSIWTIGYLRQTEQRS